MTGLLIVLKVLKILGFVLLGIIVFALLLLLFVLFAPVRYKAKGSYSGEKPVLYLKVSWLFRLVYFSFDINRSDKTSLRILGISTKKKVKKKTKESDSYYDDDEIEKNWDEEDSKTFPDNEVKETEKAEESIEHLKTKEIEYAPEEENDTVQNNSFYDKIKKYVELYKTDEFKKAYALCKDKIIKLLKHILPGRWNITCDYSFDDPATTGSVLGFVSVLYPFISKHIDVTTDFGKPHIDAKGYAIGHICIAKVLILGGMVYFNRNIKKIIRLIKEV